MREDLARLGESSLRIPRPDEHPDDTRSVFDSDAARLFAIQVIATRGIGAKSIPLLLRDLEVFRPDEILALPPQLIASRYALTLETAEHLRTGRDRARALAEELYEDGVSVVLAGSAEYPSQLGGELRHRAPPVLFAWGNLDVLSGIGVGFCGSRAAAEKTLAVVSDCSRQLARRSVNVVSGYAQGVDMAAHEGALAAGGATTAILAEGISRFRLKDRIRRFETHDLLVLSQFSPGMTWTVGNAMQRNWTICALSDALVVAESRLEGGTYAAGLAAMELGRPLYVVEFEATDMGDGNRYFLERGAKPLRRRRGGEAAVERLLEDAALQAMRDALRSKSDRFVLYEADRDRRRKAAATESQPTLL